MLKRSFDVLGAAFGLVALAPLLLVLLLACRVVFRGPAFFIQARPGLRGKPFRIFKFRSMRDSTDGEGRVLRDEQRLTRFGEFLRRTSLDELPELYNVLKGDMSLVGPRPLLMEYLPLYSDRQKRRHEMRPGITGWAQVNGRNELSWEEKFKLDVWYVDHWSFWLDLKILFLTIIKVVRRQGINEPGQATARPFRGAGS